MVIPDGSAPPRRPKIEFEPPAPLPERFARPLDRLAAVIIDVFVVLIPVYVLISAPYKRLMTASFILGSEPDFIRELAVMTALGVAVVVVYQTLMHYWFRATIGKMLFDLRVKPVFEGETISLFGWFIRSLLWLVEALPAGLPMLAVFSDPRRRTMHDRACDTIVVSRSPSAVKAPTMIERGLVRGFFAATFLFALMVGTIQLATLFQHWKAMDQVTVSGDEAECEAVSNGVNPDDDDVHARLKTAMSLYAAGLADRGCLESEVEREMAEQTPVGPVTYLAQAFVNADDAEVSNSYLDQVCDESPNSVECSMSQVVSRWSEEDWEGVENILSTAKRGSGYLEVWGIRHFMKQGEYAEALDFLDSLSEHKELAEFSLVQRVKALFDLYREPEADIALAQALPALSDEDGQDISSWMCAQELQNGCAALKSVACRSLPKGKNLAEIDFQQTGGALSRLMSLECQDGNSVDYLSFSDAVTDGDWQAFLRANSKRQKNDKPAAYKLYSEVLASQSAPDLLRVEALRRLSQFASRDQLRKVFEMWRGFDSREAWIKAGNLLLTRTLQRKDRDLALRIARQMAGTEALSPLARNELKTIGGPSNARQPASVDWRKLMSGDGEGE